MRIDFATLAFGYMVKKGGATPNWATSLGQGKDYKINDGYEIDNLLKGMVYTSVSLSNVSSKIGKGGNQVSGDSESSPILLASKFNKVFVNDTEIRDASFILIITRDSSRSHSGRLRVKYGPSNTYRTSQKEYSNADFWKSVKSQLKISKDACFFVYDISIESQEILRLRTIFVDKNKSIEYRDSSELHSIWDKLIKDDEKFLINKKNSIAQKENSYFDYAIAEDNVFTPDWFKEKAKKFSFLDQEAKEFLDKFYDLFSPEKLRKLTYDKVIYEIFLNNKNKYKNLCYWLEFNKDSRKLFGSIKSGSSFKYKLFYSPKYASWVTGTNRKPETLSDIEAKKFAVEIRDYLIAGCDVINKYSQIKTLSEYNNLYEELNKVTNGYVNRVWFLKYYALLYPELFPPIYSQSAQNFVLSKLEIAPGENSIYRLGQIKFFVDKCSISNVVFNAIFWKYCASEKTNVMDDDFGIVEKDFVMKHKNVNCMNIDRKPRKSKLYPLNFIIYGAPGTGKTYSMIEYALAIIDNIKIEEFRKNNPNRKSNINRYRQLMNDDQIVFTTFHQNYGYEEFIQGLRPNPDADNLSFDVVDGVFKNIADNAIEAEEGKNYVVIIDEINRANISKVFGELITLIEEDKRWGEINETCVTLQFGDSFAVPNNLYIIGTMNSADKSISLIDAALRRRFDFIERKPDSNLVPSGTLRDMFLCINELLVEKLDTSDLLIGHSYFMNKNVKDLKNILNNNIIPLLYEYFYDNKKKVASVISDAIEKSGANLILIDEKVGRIRVEDKDI